MNRKEINMNRKENSMMQAENGSIELTSLTETGIRVEYTYRRKRLEKVMTIGEIHKDIVKERYARRVRAVRGEQLINSTTGMGDGVMAAWDLPTLYPAQGADGAYTGLVLLSVTVDDSQERMEQLRRVVNGWQQTMLSFAGCSGRTLKIITAYSLPGGAVPTDEAKLALFRSYAYRRAADYLLATTGLRPTEVAPDGNEHCRMSSDPQAFLNTHVVPVVMEQPTAALTEQTADALHVTTDNPMAVDVLPGYTRQEMDITKFNLICRRTAFGRRRTADEYLLHIANECRRAGIDQEVATKCILWQGDYAGKDTLVRTTVENAYCSHRAGTFQPMDRSLMHQQLLEAFVHRRYLFRRNTVTGDVEYMEKERYILNWRPLTQEARNDINNAAIREGIKAWPQDLDRVVMSTQTSDYDPVREWMDKLPEWDGRDRLGELAARVPTKTPGWDDNFRVWMRSMVSQWTGGANSMYGAQMVLMLVGGQGTRKSTFMRLLLPRELMTFYIDRIDFTNKKEALRALSRFLLINIDEYDQVSKAQTAYLKHLIQRTDVKERRMYETTYEQQQRYAAFCGTTNSLVPLKDDSGSRRYLVVETSGVIDTDTTGDRRIDYAQLYAQIKYDIESGRPCYFDGKREQAIIENNAQYYDTPGVLALFEDLFRQPQAGDDVLELSPTQILQMMRDKLKVNIINRSNATILGSYLRRQSFVRIGRSYAVASR